VHPTVGAGAPALAIGIGFGIYWLSAAARRLIPEPERPL